MPDANNIYRLQGRGTGFQNLDASQNLNSNNLQGQNIGVVGDQVMMQTKNSKLG